MPDSKKTAREPLSPENTSPPNDLTAEQRQFAAVVGYILADLWQAVCLTSNGDDVANRRSAPTDEEGEK